MGSQQPTERDLAMMDKAIAEAQQAIDNGKVGVGAVLTWKDEILAIGHNMYEETRDGTEHGEMVVLHKAAKRLDQMSDAEKAELTLYTTLEPCLMCLAAISFVGIKRVVYSALIEDADEQSAIARGITSGEMNPFLNNGKLELVPGVRRKEGISLLEQMGHAAKQKK